MHLEKVEFQFEFDLGIQILNLQYLHRIVVLLLMVVLVVVVIIVVVLLNLLEFDLVVVLLM
jgi:hypothetical protein